MLYLFVTVALLIIIFSLTTCRQQRTVSFREIFEDMNQNQGQGQKVSPIENVLALSQLIDSKQAAIESTVKENSAAVAKLTKEVVDLKTYINQQVDSLSKAASGTPP